MSQEWITAAEAADILGLAPGAIMARIHRRKITARRISPDHHGPFPQWRVLRSEVEAERVARGDRKLSLADCGWVAGAIDFDGCVYITCQRKANGHSVYVLSITIGSIDQEPLEWLRQSFGGNLRCCPPPNERWSTQYRWSIQAKKAAALLLVVLPYLRIKQPQAVLGLEFQERIEAQQASRYNRVAPDELAWRERQKSLISEHNQRHRPAKPTGDQCVCRNMEAKVRIGSPPPGSP